MYPQQLNVMMNAFPKTFQISGKAGVIDVALDAPAHLPNEQTLKDVPAKGLALIAHPHPLQGGTRDNKVVTTLAKAAHTLGYVVLRPSFRGVGDSQGVYDAGNGETDDLLDVLHYAKQQWPQLAGDVLLAGFSFGSYVSTRVANVLAEEGKAAQHLVLAGLAAGKFAPLPVAQLPSTTLVVHGEHDEVIALSAVLDWARPQSLPVVVLPGVGHFFHQNLLPLRQLVVQHISAARLFPR